MRKKIMSTNYSKVHPLLCRLANEYEEILLFCNILIPTPVSVIVLKTQGFMKQLFIQVESMTYLLFYHMLE